MQKLSQRHLILKKLSKRSEKTDSEKLIKEMRETVKNDPKIIEKFKEYGVSIKNIDDIHIEFCDLDVSAKTKNRKIYINKQMLKNPDKDPTHYLVHELIHYLQQKTGKNLNTAHTNDEYLNRPTEEEAFEAQVDFKKREEGRENATDYVEQLLDYHDIDGKDRLEKEKELLDE